MKPQVCRFAVAGISIEIESDVPECSQAVSAFAVSFTTRPASSGSTLCFRFRQHAGAAFELLGPKNGKPMQSLWQSHDAMELMPAFEWHLYHQVLHALDPAWIPLHAAAVGLHQGAVMFSGASGSGKSSLATAAMLDGCSYLSDEFACLDNQGRIQPFPRPLQWSGPRHPAFRHAQMQKAGFGKSSYHFPDHRGRKRRALFWHPPSIATDALPLKAIVLPHFRPAADETADPIPRSQLLLELANETHLHPTSAGLIHRLHRMLPEGIPCLRLQFSDAHHGWKLIQAFLGGE